MSRTNYWNIVGEIDSVSEPGVFHLIKKHKTTGLLACDCMAFRFARGEKTCKHVSAYKAVTLRGEIREAVIGRDFTEMPVIAAPTFALQGMSRPGVRRLRLRD